MKEEFDIILNQQAGNRDAFTDLGKQLMTAKEVAWRLNVKPSSVYAWANSGVIPSYKIGVSLRFDAVEVEGFIDSCKVEPAPLIDVRKKQINSKVINNIIENAIASERNNVYNTPIKGKPDWNPAQRGGNNGAF